MKLKRIGYNKTEVIHNNGLTIFFSYDTPVCVKTPDYEYLKTDTFYSKTTSRHINSWLDGVNARAIPQEVINTYASGLPAKVTETDALTK